MHFPFKSKYIIILALWQNYFYGSQLLKKVYCRQKSAAAFMSTNY